MKTLFKNVTVVSLFLGTVAACYIPNIAQGVTLQQLIDGQSITIFDKVFDDWKLNANNGTLLVDLTQIEVTPLNDDPLNPGLKYTENSGALTVSDFNSKLLNFNYTVSTISGDEIIKDNSLALTDSDLGSDTVGFISINEVVTDTNNDILGSRKKTVFRDNTLPLLNDSINFPPQSQVIVNTSITVAGDNLGDALSLKMFEQRFSQVRVPEPSSTISPISLVALGALGAISIKQRA